MTSQREVKFRKWYDKFKEDNQVTFGLASEFNECWIACEADQASTIAQLKLDLEKASNAAWNNFVAIEVINDYLIELDLLVITHHGGGREVGLNIVDSIKQLHLENKKLRDALVIAKGLLDAMKWSNEEPHEGSFGWIINQALGETK